VLEPSTSARLLQTGLFPSVFPDNPINSPVGVIQAQEGRALGEIVSVVLDPQQYDVVVVHTNLQDVFAYTPNPEPILANAVDHLAKAKSAHDVPIIVVFLSNGEARMDGARVELQMRAMSVGLSVAPNIPAGLRLARLVSEEGTWRRQMTALENPHRATVHPKESLV
jgi:hypothetical protein